MSIKIISGAITDVDSAEAVKHAEMYYEEIRHMTNDVEKISKNTGFNVDSIRMVKNYLFINEHELNGEIRRFDPYFPIAESWERMAIFPDEIKHHDITLLNHELTEIKYVSMGYSQEDAHIKASSFYNYSHESLQYYESIDKKQNKEEDIDDSRSRY